MHSLTFHFSDQNQTVSSSLEVSQSRGFGSVFVFIQHCQEACEEFSCYLTDIAAPLVMRFVAFFLTCHFQEF